MIGLALAVVRGHAGPEVIESAWKMDRIDVPRAPGLGLMLDEVSAALLVTDGFGGGILYVCNLVW